MPSTSDTTCDADASLLDDLVAANHILAGEGVLDGFGHVSVRHDKRRDYFLLSSSKAPALVSREDILCFTLDARPVHASQAPLYLERFIHSEVYARHPEVSAIVHSHSPAVIPFTATTSVLKPVYHMSGFLGAGAPVFEIRTAAGPSSDMLIRTPELGRALAESVGQSTVVLIRGHGNVVMGQSLRQTVFRAVYTEINARVQIQAQALALAGCEVRYLNTAEAAAADATNGKAVGRSWDLWVRRWFTEQ